MHKSNKRQAPTQLSSKRNKKTKTNGSYNDMLSEMQNALPQQQQQPQKQSTTIPTTTTTTNPTSTTAKKQQPISGIMKELNELIQQQMLTQDHVIGNLNETVITNVLQGRNLHIQKSYNNDEQHQQFNIHLSYLIPCIHNILKAKYQPKHGIGVLILLPNQLSVHILYHYIQSILLSNTSNTDDQNSERELLLIDRIDVKTSLHSKYSTNANILITTAEGLQKSSDSIDLTKWKHLRCLVIDEYNYQKQQYPTQLQYVLNKLQNHKKQLIITSDCSTIESDEFIGKSSNLIEVKSDQTTTRKTAKREVIQVEMKHKIYTLFKLIREQVVEKKQKAIVLFDNDLTVQFMYYLFRRIYKEHIEHSPYLFNHSLLKLNKSDTTQNARNHMEELEQFITAKQCSLLFSSLQSIYGVPNMNDNVDMVIVYDNNENNRQHLTPFIQHLTNNNNNNSKKKDSSRILTFEYSTATNQKSTTIVTESHYQLWIQQAIQKSKLIQRCAERCLTKVFIPLEAKTILEPLIEQELKKNKIVKTTTSKFNARNLPLQDIVSLYAIHTGMSGYYDYIEILSRVIQEYVKNGK